MDGISVSLVGKIAVAVGIAISGALAVNTNLNTDVSGNVNPKSVEVSTDAGTNSIASVKLDEPKVNTEGSVTAVSNGSVNAESTASSNTTSDTKAEASVSAEVSVSL